MILSTVLAFRGKDVNVMKHHTVKTYGGMNVRIHAFLELP
jgi:hypothetical protein